MDTNLKLKLLFLSMVFPLSFMGIGWLLAWYHHLIHLKIALALLGFAMGIAVNFICYSRKLFTLALFYTPLPLAIFMLTWWLADVFTTPIYSFLLGGVGLLVGLWLNKELVLPFQFYKIKKRILAVVFFFFNIVCAGFFLGIPIFNLLLGFLAGNYLSIRVMSNYQRIRYVNKNLQQGALFTAATMLIINLISGFSFINDSTNTLHVINSITGYLITERQLIQLILIGGGFLTVFQYFITKITAQTMLRLWKFNKSF